MLSFPNAKINLGLNITSKRPDGYHDLESCFYPIPWKDVLEITPAKKLTFQSTGLPIPGNPEKNLCLQAYHLLAVQYGLPPVHIHLHKVIPMGAGLGGGSANGAFTLKLLNELFELELQTDTLQKLAAQLGSDCPFFIKNEPVFATGTGTQFEPLSIDLSGMYLAIHHPKIHIGTKESYSRVKPQKPQRDIRELLKSPIADWKNNLNNDFEKSIFPAHPEIERIKNELYELGALYASMTGSGSAVYGIFEQSVSVKNYFIFQL